jgi:CheY-like chemotaxis protein
VLIADDNVDARESLGALLELAGHDVLLAGNGEEALRLAASERPGVAILDIGMPVLNGYEAARRIRASDWGAAVMLIAVTGWGQADDQARARDAGFDHHCTKPVDFQQLQELLGGRGA